MYKTIRSSRLYEQIVEQIEQAILKGELKRGDQLPAERELAEQFGVSRTAVREAVKALLVANGFLEAQLDELRKAVSTGYSRGKYDLPRDRKDSYD